MQALRTSLEAKASAELTFKPKIASAYHANRAYTPLVERILEAEVRRRMEAHTLQEQHFKRWAAEVTFNPTISERAAAIHNEVPVFDRLFHDNKERKSRATTLEKRYAEDFVRVTNHHTPTVSAAPSEGRRHHSRSPRSPDLAAGAGSGSGSARGAATDSPEGAAAEFNLKHSRAAVHRQQAVASHGGVFGALHYDAKERDARMKEAVAEDVSVHGFSTHLVCHV